MGVHVHVYIHGQFATRCGVHYRSINISLGMTYLNSLLFCYL